MTDTAGSMPGRLSRVGRDRPPRTRMLRESPAIEDPNSPQMTAMIKSMLLEQKREERQSRLPELSPPEPSPPMVEPQETEDGKLTRLDISKLVPAMPALRGKSKEDAHDAAGPEEAAVEPEEEADLLRHDLFQPEPEDVISPEDLTKAVEESRAALAKPRSGDRIKTVVSAMQTYWAVLLPYLRKIKPKHVGIAAAVLIVLLRPWLVVGVTLTLLMVFAITYLSLGHERFCELLLGRWLSFEKRRPRKAQIYLNKATKFVEQYNAKVARLPEKVAERLTMPDLAELLKEDDRPDPFERLNEKKRPNRRARSV